MERPRFRRWFGFSYLPLNLAGGLVFVAFLTLEILTGLLIVHLDPESLASAFGGILGFGIFLGFWAFIHWRVEEP